GRAISNSRPRESVWPETLPAWLTLSVVKALDLLLSAVRLQLKPLFQPLVETARTYHCDLIRKGSNRHLVGNSNSSVSFCSWHLLRHLTSSTRPLLKVEAATTNPKLSNFHTLGSP